MKARLKRLIRNIRDRGLGDTAQFSECDWWGWRGVETLGRTLGWITCRVRCRRDGRVRIIRVTRRGAAAVSRELEVRPFSGRSFC